MAPTPARTLACLVLATGLLAACSRAPDPSTGIAEQSTTAPAPTTPPVDTSSPTGTSDVPNTPDLSGATIDCEAMVDPCDHGDDPQLDRLWDACAAGDGAACDRLYYDSAFDSRYEQFGNTCGDRDVLVPCPPDLS